MRLTVWSPACGGQTRAGGCSSTAGVLCAAARRPYTWITASETDLNAYQKVCPPSPSHQYQREQQVFRPRAHARSSLVSAGLWTNLPPLHGGLLISYSIFAARCRWGQPFSAPMGSLGPFWDVGSREPQNFSACRLWFMNTECARPSAESPGSSGSTPWPAALNNSAVLATLLYGRLRLMNAPAD